MAATDWPLASYNPARHSRMRFRLVPLVAVLLFAPLARAARPVTVAQMEQILHEDQGQSDGRVAGQLAGLTLTERVTAERLADWQSRFPGRRTQQALLLLADESAFLPLPVSDISPDPPPGLPAEGKIFGAALVYANKTIRNLPNLMATRQTLHFEASPDEVMEQAENANAAANFAGGILSLGKPSPSMESVNTLPLQLTEKVSAPVTYRDGKEVRSGGGHGGKHNLGLTTTGEFGPILTIVLGDAIHGRILWDYWQQQGGTRLAVFRYQVPAEKSHYLVQFPSGHTIARTWPAYHGEIAVDPATGTIERISILSEASPPFQNAGTGILVEYGAVVLGGRSTICPLHGVAISKTPVVLGLDSLHSAETPWEIDLNDVAFTRYHLFRADVRILNKEESERLGQPASGSPPQ